MRIRRSSLAALAALLAALGVPSSRAESEGHKRFIQKPNDPTPGRFTFARIEYDSVGGYGEAYYDYDGRRWLRWQTDYPESDQNLLYRLSELTTIDPNPQPVVLRLTDPHLREYPFIWMSDPGWAKLSKAEIEGLRGYLLGGGFLWVDDFWGDAEFESMEDILKAAIPEYPWRPIPHDHPIMNIVFPFKEIPQIPAIDFVKQGWTYEPAFIHKSGGTEECHFRGCSDDKGRLMVVMTHNTDFGDGFEREAEEEDFFKEYSVKAYGMAVNIVTYMLTH